MAMNPSIFYHCLSSAGSRGLEPVPAESFARLCEEFSLATSTVFRRLSRIYYTTCARKIGHYFVFCVHIDRSLSLQNTAMLSRCVTQWLSLKPRTKTARRPGGGRIKQSGSTNSVPMHSQVYSTDSRTHLKDISMILHVKVGLLDTGRTTLQNVL